MSNTVSIVSWAIAAGGSLAAGALAVQSDGIPGWDKLLAGGGVASACGFIVWLFLKRDEVKTREANETVKAITDKFGNTVDTAVKEFADTSEKGNQRWAETTATMLKDFREREKETATSLHQLVRDIHEKRT